MSVLISVKSYFFLTLYIIKKTLRNDKSSICKQVIHDFIKKLDFPCFNCFQIIKFNFAHSAQYDFFFLNPFQLLNVILVQVTCLRFLQHISTHLIYWRTFLSIVQPTLISIHLHINKIRQTQTQFDFTWHCSWFRLLF